MPVPDVRPGAPTQVEVDSEPTPQRPATIA